MLNERDILLLFRNGFQFFFVCFFTTEVAWPWAILDRTSGSESLSETIAPKYLKLVTVSSFCPFTLIFFRRPFGMKNLKFQFSMQTNVLSYF